MKISQWIGALAAMVAVVFGVTFFMNYTPPTPGSDNGSVQADTADLPTLTFPLKQYPLPYQSQLQFGQYELEMHRPGYQDFWFSNDSPEKIRVGLESKSCKCQGVDVYIMPEGTTGRLPGIGPLHCTTLAIGPMGFHSLLLLAERLESDRDLEGKAESVTTLNRDDSKADAVVPGNRVGWVRMKWTGEKAGPINLTVKLWMHSPATGLTVDLERKANFLAPVLVMQGDQAIGPLQPEQLPKQYGFLVWSSTRRSFKITKLETIRPAGLAPSADAFLVGEPVALNAEACFNQEQKSQIRILSAYAVPVTFAPVAPDGKTPFDLGNFRRQVEIQTDLLDKPLAIGFRGRIEGDLHIHGTDETGALNFGSFRRDSEPARSVLISSGSSTKKLELDKSRIPEYVRAKLTEEPRPGELGKAWKLEVQVLPSVYGHFPRDDDPAYRDSAVYVRTADPISQSFRVALKGDAVDR